MQNSYKNTKINDFYFCSLNAFDSDSSLELKEPLKRIICNEKVKIGDNENLALLSMLMWN